MGLVLSIILILIVALVLYNHIANQLPKKLRFLGSSTHKSADSLEGSSTTKVPTYGPMLPPASANYWLAYANGSNSRVVRAFGTPIEGEGQVYDAPLMYFSCYDGKLYSWLDTRLRAASAKGNPGAVLISVNGGRPSLWPREAGTVVASPDPQALLGLAERGKQLTLSLAFDGAPEQTLTLDLQGALTLKNAIQCAK